MVEIDLKQFGNVPTTTDVIVSLLDGYKAPLQKLAMMERSGELIRLRRGLYVVSPKVSGRRLSLPLIANHLCAPSYLSMQSALREYGLIPERVYTIRSMTMTRSKRIMTSLGEFAYVQCAPEYYNIGVSMHSEEGVTYMMASPEKALCDLVTTTAGLNLRYQAETREYLEEDLRMDMDALREMNTDIIRRCASTGKKTRSLLNIAQLIDKL